VVAVESVLIETRPCGVCGRSLPDHRLAHLHRGCKKSFDRR
jgi:hypothetical protein